MKEFLYAIKYTIIFQILCWGIFILCDENKLISQSDAENLALYSGIAILIGLLVIYYICVKKIIKKHNLNSTKFNIILLLLWSVSSKLITNGLNTLVINKKIHICQGSGWECFLNGIEYDIEGLLMIALAILILIINLIIIIYKYIKKKK